MQPTPQTCTFSPIPAAATASSNRFWTSCAFDEMHPAAVHTRSRIGFFAANSFSAISSNSTRSIDPPTFHPFQRSVGLDRAADLAVEDDDGSQSAGPQATRDIHGDELAVTAGLLVCPRGIRPHGGEQRLASFHVAGRTQA